MKHYLFSTLVFFLILSGKSEAQTLHRLGVGFGGGYSHSVTANYGSGFILFFQPSFTIDRNWTTGFRYEGNYSKHLSALSYTVNASYFFSKSEKKATPFIGIGFGVYRYNYAINVYTTSANQVPSVGVYPTVGLDFGRFFIQSELNICSRSQITMVEHAFGGSKSYLTKVGCSYIAVKGGIYFGKERRKFE
jgi:hypothetical protein